MEYHFIPAASVTALFSARSAATASRSPQQAANIPRAFNAIERPTSAPEARANSMCLASKISQLLRSVARLRQCLVLVPSSKMKPASLPWRPKYAAQLVLSWSHRGRVESEAAFARLAGAAPIPASSGQTIRYRLDRCGDRKLNRALHMILVTRKRTHPATTAYIERRLAEGKTRREANRCLKRYLARNLYRLLERPPMTT